ncbi:hypothetical protein [Actinoplanes xinjiangensis]|uniref:hypothetical protein n=1 Tax=Actinoplanes xinjiangensis TaxID=512350 RepID=UPI003F4E44CB
MATQLNANTNGPLRQYLPQSSDLSVHTAEDLTAAAAEFSNRPCKVLELVHPRPRRLTRFVHPSRMIDIRF